MSEDLDSRLRAALSPVAPSDEFTRNLIAHVTADLESRGNAPGATADQESRANASGARRRRRQASAWWLSASMAASLLIATAIQHQLHQRRDNERGLEARREVIEALRVTSRKLDLAYEAIRSQSASSDDEKPGV
jgi:hypothetical protein